MNLKALFLQRNFKLRDDIPRFVTSSDINQQQTSNSFGFKWAQKSTYNSKESRDFTISWYLKKYGFETIEEMGKYFSQGELVLDLGCGSGFSSSLWLRSPGWNNKTSWVGVDISEAIDIAKQSLQDIPNTYFIQADALNLPFKSNLFDKIYSEGVLHHTPSTKQALKEAVRVLKPKGKIVFYIYKKKGLVREVMDDYIREKISSLTNEEAWKEMEELTKLGQVLTEVKIEIEFKEDNNFFEIKAGKYLLRDLIYYNFVKSFWNETLSFNENVHINFDWYKPRYAFRHTKEEVQDWCNDLSLKIIRHYEDGSGHSVIAEKL